MAARRCTLCAINYPVIEQFRTCPIHEEATELRQGAEPDPNWKDAFERMRKQFESQKELNSRAIPLVRGITAVEEDGRYFVSQPELFRAGLRLSRMQPDQFYLFELEDGWVYETQGWDDPRRRWWIERVTEGEESTEIMPAGEHSSIEPATL